MLPRKTKHKRNNKQPINSLNLDNIIDDSDEEPDPSSPYNKYSEIVHCKTKNSALQKNENLKIIVKNPKLIKTGLLTSYNQYTIEIY